MPAQYTGVHEDPLRHAPLGAADCCDDPTEPSAHDRDLVHTSEEGWWELVVPREPFGLSTTPGDVEELVRRAQRGDTAAMNALLIEIAPYVGRICGAVALDAGDDATQEALVAIFRNLP